MTDAKTTVCALLGDPVEHSHSPLIQNSFSETEGVNNIYTAFRLKKGEAGTALKGAFSLGIKGFNITVPHKTDVIPYLCYVDPLAERIGAVNTLVLTEQGYAGYNTDIYGFMRQTEESGFDITGKKVIMIGAGGAANAVLQGLYELGAAGVYILNRSVDKAVQKFGQDERNVILPLNAFKEIPGSGYFCAQCTSVGLFPGNSDSPIEDKEFFEKISYAVDVIYNPEETAFMKKVRACGGKAENGLKMLLYQAVEAFYRFHGVRVSDSGVETARKKLYEKVYGGDGKNNS